MVICLHVALHSAGFLSFRCFKTPHIGLLDIPYASSEDLPIQWKQNLHLPVMSRKRPLLQQQSSLSKSFKPSLANRKFLQLTDHLNELMQFCDPKIIVEHCSSLMASDIHNITVFPTEYVKKLKNYNHTPSLLRILSSFWTWSDHSVLRVLLKFDSKAISLLDEYDSQINLVKPLYSYPLPPPSSYMIPNDNSTHTILAIKCAQQYYQCLLKHVFEVRSKITNKFDITPHSLQLIATKNSSTVLYWLIPKSVVALISTKALEYSSALHEEEILEVCIFPGLRITTKAINLSGPLAFLSPTMLSSKEVHKFTYTYVATQLCLNIIYIHSHTIYAQTIFILYVNCLLYRTLQNMNQLL